MAEGTAPGIWSFRLLYLAILLLVVFILLLPLRIEAGALPGPDVVLAVTLAWAMRRHDHLPIVLLAAALLTVDLLLMRPPGLMAVLTVLAVEVIRAREYQWRDMPLAVEWMIGAALIAGISIANALVLAVLVVPQATLGQMLLRLIFTVLAYPVAALTIRYLLGVPRGTGEAEIGGRS